MAKSRTRGNALRSNDITTAKGRAVDALAAVTASPPMEGLRRPTVRPIGCCSK